MNLTAPGLLARMGQIFMDFDLTLETAKILTEGERIDDIFYLTDKNGEPISDPKVSRRSLEMNQPLLFFWESSSSSSKSVQFE